MILSTRIQAAFLVICFGFVVVANAYDYDPNDFAAEVVEYVQGTGVGNDYLSGAPFNNPDTALGRPTLETTGDGWYINPGEAVPVVPVYPAFRAFEIVTIGNDGYLTVKFNHPVWNDENNLYGVDFIVFGNARLSSGQPWENGNPEDEVVDGSLFAEPGIVSVSQDGQNWHYFSSGSYADSFAPTAGYRWDDFNDLWAEELDPTRPVDPNLDAGALAGKTVAEVIEAYNGSAGGTGFDIAELGLDWIMYVRIEDDQNSSVTTELDAVADVSCCGDYKHLYPVGDLDEDCRVGYMDLKLFFDYWLAEITGPDDPAAVADIYEDGIVDFYDWALLADNWLECTWECE